MYGSPCRLSGEYGIADNFETKAERDDDGSASAEMRAPVVRDGDEPAPRPMTKSWVVS